MQENNNNNNHSNQIDITTLDALSPEIIQNQATINLGTLGHVSHGKSTIVEGITGIKPMKQEEELKRNITIKLGYANFKIFQCEKCPKPQCYHACKSDKKMKPKCSICSNPLILVRHFSFVDCPGHDVLMSTMLNGAAVMNAALLIVAANQTVPQPQTAEHIVAAEIMKLPNIIIVQTKIDLIDEQQAYSNYEQILEFIKATVAEKSPIIPITCTPKRHINLDVLLEYLVNTIPVPILDMKSPALMTVIRSFDINKPGTIYHELKGGVAGGSIIRGVLKIGQRVEIRPGIMLKEKDGRVKCIPLFSKIVSLRAENNPLQFAVPGGLIAVGLTLDPALTKSDRLQGQFIGEVGTLPPVFQNMEIKFQLMKRMIGICTTEVDQQQQQQVPEKVEKLQTGENLLVNIGASTIQASVIAVKKDLAKLNLKRPCCVNLKENISLSRKIEGSYRLIGRATIMYGESLPLESSE